MKKKAIFIINLISGTSDKAAIPGLIDQLLDKEKFEYEIAITEYAGHASEIAAKAKDDGVDMVVAVGGDGTVNEVARAIVHSNTALGIIPCGSGNGLARHLQLPINVKKSIEIINAFEVRDLDYGIINGYPFFCTCGMGFDAFISLKFAEAGKRGPLTYIENVLREGLKYEPETYTVMADDETSLHKAFLISCANASQYGNNAYIAPQASMSDGLMDVIIMEPFGLIDAPQISIEMFNKTLNKNNSKIKTFRCKKLHVHRDSPGAIHYDGDPVMTGDNIDSSNKVLAYQTGYAANSFYVYQQVYDKNGKPLEGVVVDRNGDGVISEADRYLYKSSMAPVTMGFSTRVEWKNFDLGFSLRASLGNYLYNNFEQGQRLKTTSAVWCQDSYLANRSVSSLGWLSDSNTSKLSDYFVQNASFLKMDNITLGYSFDRLFKSGSWKGISGRVYASCSNVFTITKYSGIDPEVYSGIDKNVYPRPITFQFGLNLNF